MPSHAQNNSKPESDLRDIDSVSVESQNRIHVDASKVIEVAFATNIASLTAENTPVALCEEKPVNPQAKSKKTPRPTLISVPDTETKTESLIQSKIKSLNIPITECYVTVTKLALPNAKKPRKTEVGAKASDPMSLKKSANMPNNSTDTATVEIETHKKNKKPPRKTIGGFDSASIKALVQENAAMSAKPAKKSDKQALPTAGSGKTPKNKLG